MRISINDKQKQISAVALERIAARVESAFSKFSQHIVSIDLVTQDVNGPRGGVDKRCQVLVNLRKKKQVVVTSESEALSKAISTAIERAKRTTGRNIKRRQIRNAGRQSNFTFGFQS